MINYSLWFKKKKPSKCLKENNRVFSGAPVFKKPPCNTGGLGLIPGGGTKIPQATQNGQKKDTYIKNKTKQNTGPLPRPHQPHLK